MKQRPNKSNVGLGLMVAALVSGVTLTSIATSEAASRVHRHYNIPSERGYGPAPTGQYRSFEELDHFPGSDNG
jgi:hypothetical protein